MGSNEVAFLANLREQNRAFYDTELGRAALKDLNKLFPRHWLYVAELLQNALDAGATRIAFKLGPLDSVIVEHDGQEFSGDDVRALCVKGGSTKGVGTIGFMGVGFKSIYQAFETVEVSSGPWRFRLQVPITRGRYDNKSRRWVGAMLPEHDDTIVVPSANMTCRFMLTRRVEGLGRVEDDFRHLTGDDDALVALLARRGVRRLELSSRSWDLSASPEVELPDRARFRITARSLHDGSTRDWMLLSRTYEPSRDAVKRLLEHRDLDPSPEDEDRVYAAAARPRTVEVFFQVDSDDSPLLPERGGLFALLPTSISGPFGFHVQADWLLAITRQDLMDLVDNPWHEEIRSQVPGLVRDYLEWMAATRAPRTARPALYGIFPTKHDNEIDRWFTAKPLLAAMAREIEETPFLPPVRDGGDDESVTWIAPSLARQLPEALADQVDRPSNHPRQLFGENVTNRRTLGHRAVGFLREVGLWREMSPAELAVRWQRVFKGWWESLSKAHRSPVLEQLYAGLAQLDEIPAWRTAVLMCVPTDEGAITTRAAARRYPAEWSLLANSPEIASLLSSRLGPTDVRFPFEIDRAWTQTQSKALPFLRPITAPLVDTLVSEWWNSLPRIQDEAGIGVIVRFTDWVRTKQPQRKKAIPFLLCDTPNGVELVPCEGALLAEPYTNATRRLLFPHVPAVAPHYEAQTEGSAQEWRLFFLNLDPKPQGEFLIWLTLEQVAPEQVNTKLKGPVPTPRVRPRPRMTFDVFGSWRVPYRQVALVDAHLAEAVLEHVGSQGGGAAFAAYLSEGVEKLRKWSRRVMRYVADVTETQTDVQTDPARWVGQLTNLSWVPVQGDERLYRPAEVLAQADDARPGAPTAFLPDPLLSVLLAAGVPFGRELADAPVLARLRVHGPTATVEELREWIGEAIHATRDNSDLAVPTRAILALPLFPLPDGVDTIDGLRRIPYDRFTRKSRPRSDLGGWIVPVDRLPEGAEVRTLLDQIAEWESMPETTTLRQAVTFLKWVYASQPEAERVRHVLPIAYGYVREDGAEAEWGTVRGDARVFVQRAREWTPVGTENLYVDDLRDPVLEAEMRTLRLATGGHLGATASDRLGVAQRLGIPFVSQRFRVDAEFLGSDDAPRTWKDGFASIVEWLVRQQSESADDDDVEVANSAAASQLGVELVRHQQLTLTVFDNGVSVRTANARVLVDSRRVGVMGTPAEFAEELAQMLIHKSELSRRRDAVRLTAQCMGHLLLLDQPAALARRLSGEPMTAEPNVENATGDNDPTHQPPTKPNSDLEAVLDDETPPGSEAAGGVSESGGETNPDIAATRDGAQPATRPPSAKQPTFTEESLAAMVRSLFLRLVPLENSDTETDPAASTGTESDETPYREAVLRWEEQHGRFPLAKSGTQAGHDIDSFTHEESHPERRLIRRIEVKGKGVKWMDQEIVTPSMRQFLDAAQLRVEEDVLLHADFDYWLYVVETDANGQRHVLPIRNPARAGKVAVRADLWRRLVEADVHSPTNIAGASDDCREPQPSVVEGQVDLVDE